MAKKIVIDQEITSLDQPWGGTYASGQEWGLKKERVETFIKSKLSEHETSIGNKVSGVIVNNTEVTKDLNGKVSLNIPTVSNDVTNTSNPNAAQAGAVAVELNAQKSFCWIAFSGMITPESLPVMLFTVLMITRPRLPR